MVAVLPFLTAATLVAAHLLAGHRPFRLLRQRKWHAFAGGAAVCYVFFHVLPRLHGSADELASSDGLWPGGEWIFVTALAGTCAFHAVDGYVRKRADGAATEHMLLDFWIHIAAFALYNALIGYLLVVDPYEDVLDAIVYQAALVLHFVVLDQTLSRRHRRRYETFGRWFMAASVALGWALASLDLSNGTVNAVAFAFLAGGMIVNVMKEELSSIEPARILPFLIGAGTFSVLFLLARIHV